MSEFNTGIPNIRVVIREARDENAVVDVPSLVVKVERNPDYNVNIIPSTQVVLRTGSFFNIADLAINAISSSYALTASYALVAQKGGFPFSGSAVITGSLLIYSGSGLIVSGPVSFTEDLSVGGTITAEKLLVSSSIIYESGSTKFGDSSEDTHQFTGSVLVQGPIEVSDGITGSLYGTASVADGIDVIFAGVYETGSDSVIIPTPSGGLSYITSASYALTASYALNGGGGTLDTSAFATTGSNQFKESQGITGSLTFDGGGRLQPNGDYNGSIDLIAGSAEGRSQLQSYDANQYVWVDNNGVHIATNLLAVSYQWIFDKAGLLSVPGTINILNNEVVGDTTVSSVGGTPIALNYGITKGDLENRFTGVKVRNYDYSGGNLAGEVSIWTDSEAQDFSTQRVLVDGFGNVVVTGSLTVTGTTNITGSLYGTSSWAETVLSASYAPTILPNGVVSSSVQISESGFVSSSTISVIQTITSASYATITPVSGTLYIIID